MIDERVKRAAAGDKAALQAVVEEVRDGVYRLAFRMLGHAEDAEDATQEILVKVVTHLGSFAGESKLTTWVYRIAANHLTSVKRGRREMFSFEMMEGFIAQGLATPAPMPSSPARAEQHVLAEEVRLGCTQGALLSLDREHRLAFALAELLELPGDVAAEVLDVEPATYRKRVQRARERLTEFMRGNCGLVDAARPCRCEKQIEPSARAGMLDPQNLVYITHASSKPRDARLLQAVDEMKDLERKASMMVAGHPEYVAPERLVEKVRTMIANLA